MDGFDDRDWGRVFSGLSGRVAAVGPTHRAHLAALKLLPTNSPRGFALQQAAAAALLQSLLKVQVMPFAAGMQMPGSSLHHSQITRRQMSHTQVDCTSGVV